MTANSHTTVRVVDGDKTTSTDANSSRQPRRGGKYDLVLKSEE